MQTVMRWLGCFWLISALLACAVPPTKPHASPHSYLHDYQKVEQATYILIPGWLYEHDRDGASLQELADGLKAHDVPYLFAPISSENSQSINAHIIADLIHATAGPLVLVSGSRGTGETAIALTLISEADQKRIQLWISISGAHNGSPIADYYSLPGIRLAANIWAHSAGGGSIANIDEFNTGRSQKRFDALVLPQVPAVSIVTVAYDCDEQKGFDKIGCRMVMRGERGRENDGLLVSDDQILPGSTIIRAYGQRHMLDPGWQSPLLASLLDGPIASAILLSR